MTANQKKAIRRRMRNFFVGVWEGFTEPFLFIFNIIAYPFRAVRRFRKFLNTEPDERPITEVFADLISKDDVRQMLWYQVEVLRLHLLRAVLALVVTVCISFFFTQQFMGYLAIPIGGMDKLVAVEMTENIGVFMRVALFLGIALAVPYIAFELWLFAAPGLRPRERKIGLVGIPLTLIFFLGGVAFTFYIMLPAAIPFLIDFLGMKTSPRPQSYFSLITGLMFWIGIFFEYPLVIYVLSAIGIIDPKVLREQWRLAIVIITIVAAVITPTVDPINQGLVMAPMIMLYFLSIVFSQIAYAGRKRDIARAQEQAKETEAGTGGA
jgi:sec-independent protein translocase protein TatC